MIHLKDCVKSIRMCKFHKISNLKQNELLIPYFSPLLYSVDYDDVDFEKFWKNFQDKLHIERGTDIQLNEKVHKTEIVWILEIDEERFHIDWIIDVLDGRA